MTTYKTSDYFRIAKAIDFIASHTEEQPSLESISRQIHLSPFHFQRLFRSWAGITPKRFLEILTLEHAKALLAESTSLLQASAEVGLSSSSRLHDHFVHLDAITPGQFKSKGRGLSIQYGMHDTPFGITFIAMTRNGICDIAFINFQEKDKHLDDLRTRWPHADINMDQGKTRTAINSLFTAPRNWDRPLSLYVSGTNFQVRVWTALLKIPMGKVVSYAHIAAAIDRPKSVRAVGQAVAANPIAFVIPCHRVIHRDGRLGDYRWGPTRKQAMLAWETARCPKARK